MNKVLSRRIIRFILVGIGNTAINFLILNAAFYVLHQGKLVSSFIATGCAIVLSFFLNRNFVFRHRGLSWQQPVLFIIVTVTGVLLVQNSIYAVSLHAIQPHTANINRWIYGHIGIRLSGDFLDVNLSNVVASVGAIVWNYNGYRWFVFKGYEEEFVSKVDMPG